MKFRKSFLLGTLIFGLIGQITPVLAEPPTQPRGVKIIHTPKVNFGTHLDDDTNSNQDHSYEKTDANQKVTQDDTSLVVHSDLSTGFNVKLSTTNLTAKDGSIIKGATVIFHGIHAKTFDENGQETKQQIPNVPEELAVVPGETVTLVTVAAGFGLGTTIFDFEKVEIVLDTPDVVNVEDYQMEINVTATDTVVESPIATPEPEFPVNKDEEEVNDTDNQNPDSPITTDPINPVVPVKSQILIEWLPEEVAMPEQPDAPGVLDPLPEEQKEPKEDKSISEAEPNSLEVEDGLWEVEPPHISIKSIYFDYTTKEEAREAYNNGEIDELTGAGIEASNIYCQQGKVVYGEFVADPEASTGSYSEGIHLSNNNNAVLMTFEDLTSLGRAFTEPKSKRKEFKLNPNGLGYLAGNVKISTIGSTEKLTDTNSMFYDSRRLTGLNLSEFDTENVVDMSKMFEYCHNLQNLNLTNFQTRQVQKMNNMFSNCHTLPILDVSSFDTSQVTTMEKMFNNCLSLHTFDLRNFKTENVTTMKKMFNLDDLLLGGSKDVNIDVMTLQKQNQIMGNMDSSGPTGVPRVFDLTSFNTGQVIDLSYMFHCNLNLYEVDLNSFDTSNVITMEEMFEDCHSLQKLDLSHFKTDKVENLAKMVQDCYELTEINFSDKFITPQVETMEAMFQNCGSNEPQQLHLDLRSFSTRSNTNITDLFTGTGLTSYDVDYIASKWLNPPIFENDEISEKFKS